MCNVGTVQACRWIVLSPYRNGDGLFCHGTGLHVGIIVTVGECRWVVHLDSLQECKCEVF
jgi:hypothetical protein